MNNRDQDVRALWPGQLPLRTIKRVRRMTGDYYSDMAKEEKFAVAIVQDDDHRLWFMGEDNQLWNYPGGGICIICSPWVEVIE